MANQRSLTLAQYWHALDDSLKEFKATPATNDKDVKNYETQRRFLEKMLALGNQVESSSVIGKTTAGLELQSYPEKAFPGKRVLTEIAGTLSCAFAKQVYLSHLKRFNLVTYENQPFYVRSFSNLENDKKDAANLASTLDDAIKVYEEAQAKKDKTSSSVLAPQRLLSPRTSNASHDCTATTARTISITR